MEHSAPYMLSGLTLAVGPQEHESEPAHFAGTVVLNVEFLYDAGYPGRPPRPGDPGDDGLPEMFDFKRLVTTHPVVLETRDRSLRVIVNSGADLYERLSFATLAQIEADLIQRRRESRLDAKLDAAVIGQFLGDMEALR